MVFAMLKWWYGRGLAGAVDNLHIWPHKALRTFSVPLLIKTLFAPWKRIISSGGRGFDAKVQEMIDNLVSRFVGFSVRSTVLFLALFTFLGSALAAVAVLIVWPFLPALIIYCVIKGVIG